MKILHTVESYPPSLGGMQEVVKQLSERLVKMGNDVTVATSKNEKRIAKIVNGVKIEDFNIQGNLVSGMTGDVEAYRRFVIESEFDIVTNFAAQQWATDALLPVLDQIKAKKVFVPTGFSRLYFPEYQTYFESMKLWLKKYDTNVFLSDNYRDINFARACGVSNLVLIPNGAAADEFESSSSIDVRNQLEIPAEHFLILHVGSHTSGKGHREAIQIFHHAKIKNATFLLIANSLGRGCSTQCGFRKNIFNNLPNRIFDQKRVIITTLSREVTVAAYKTADLFLFPSNIECSPIVLFECMASQTPFLTTDVGNALEIIDWSGAGIALPTIKDSNGNSKAEIKSSAKILERIYNDADMRKAMAKSGYSAWRGRFTWEKITDNYEDLYFTLLNNG